MSVHPALRPWLAAALLTVTVLAPAAAQQPTFRSGSDVVTVDVVVFDKQGNPVEGLTRNDFAVREDGKPQDIAAFDAVSLRASAAPAPRAQRVSTNSEQPDAAARWFFLVFDDANIDPRSSQRARDAMSKFITDVLRPGDRVMIAAASGSSAWSGELPQDRADLLAFISRLQGEHRIDNSPRRIWDHEAMAIALGRDQQALSQVVRRFYENDVIVEAAATPQDPGTRKDVDVDPGVAMVRVMARQTYAEATSRIHTTFGRLQRLSAALAEARGRKTLLLFSEGFIQDNTQPDFRTLLQTARNANVAIHFVDVSSPGGVTGGEGIPGGGAEVGRAVLEQDAAITSALATRESEGARSIAKETGGTTISGTNLMAGLSRVAAESRAYYLVGYSPKNTKRDGKFRQIQVAVSRPDVTVRARGGYYAPSDKDAPQPTADKLDPNVRAALDSPFSAPGLPMRLASYVMGPRPDGKVQALLVAEADIEPLQLKQFLGAYSAKLDSYVLVHDRDRDDLQRDEKLIELSLPPDVFEQVRKTGLPVQRELALTPGHYQATVLLRDRATGLLGSVRQDFDVPAPDAFHLSTPIVTDRLQQDPVASAARPVPIAHRAFRAGTRVFAAFDVYGASQPAGAAARVTLAYTLRKADGTVITATQPQPLRPNARGQFSVTLGVTLPQGAAGDHELVIAVRDEAAGKSLETVEPLTIAR